MKKLLLLFILSAASFTTFAQDQDGYSVNVNRLTGGIKEGLSFADMPRSLTGGSPGSVSSSPVVTWNSSLWINYKINKPFSFEAGFMYAGTGANNKTSVTNNGITTAYNTQTYLYYGQIPVNLIYSIPQGDNSLRFGFGPYIAHCFRGRTTGTMYVTNNGETKTTKVDETLTPGSNGPTNLKSTDYGFDPSVSYQLETGFLVNLSYYYGMENVYNSQTFSDQGITTKAHNRVLTLSIGVFF